jgi:hypothetical protein
LPVLNHGEIGQLIITFKMVVLSGNQKGKNPAILG